MSAASPDQSRVKLVQPAYAPLRFRAIAGWLLAGAAAFHIAYEVPAAAGVMLIFLFSLLRLAQVRTSRQAMNIGWVLGLLIYGPQLAFFWTIFGPGAATLWLVLAFWLGLFLVTLRECHLRFGRAWAIGLAPVLWLGTEFFRSELYYLRFTWVTPGFAFSGQSGWLAVLGVYGVGFVLMCLGAVLHAAAGRKFAVWLAAAVAGLSVAVNIPRVPAPPNGGAVRTVPVAGVQLEFPGEPQVLVALESLRKRQTNAELFVLSEYTFDGPVPEKVRDWCRKHGKFLVAGGKDLLNDGRFRNTAFVIGTNGEIVFQQAKAVPIQFFKDGLPALDQKLWDSPWGRIGIGTCYDFSCTRVTDRLVALGAQALINPTMDVEDWGKRQHELHSRVVPTRAAEYGLPIFRVASSGVSQLADARGTVLATAPFAQEEAQISGTLTLIKAGRKPHDRWLAPIAVGVTGLVMAVLGAGALIRWLNRRRSKPAAVQTKE
jgi:apolipoprotein N-acyltransferase